MADSSVEAFFDIAIEALATASAFTRSMSARTGAYRSMPTIGPSDLAVQQLVRRLGKLRTAAELRESFGDEELVVIENNLWQALCRYAEAFERGFGDAGRLRTLRKKAAAWQRLISRDTSATKAAALVAAMLGVANESVVRNLLKPVALKNRIGLEDSEPRALRPVAK